MKEVRRGGKTRGKGRWKVRKGKKRKEKSVMGSVTECEKSVRMERKRRKRQVEKGRRSEEEEEVASLSIGQEKSLEEATTGRGFF